MKRNTKGFTLIELLIVVVIIGILAAIAIPKFAATKEKAYLARMKTDLRNLVTAEEGYSGSNNGVYLAPNSAAALTTLNVQLSTGNSIAATGTAVGPVGSAAPGWNAKITSASTTKACYIYVGGAPNLAPSGAVGAGDSTPACDP